MLIYYTFDPMASMQNIQTRLIPIDMTVQKFLDTLQPPLPPSTVILGRNGHATRPELSGLAATHNDYRPTTHPAVFRNFYHMHLVGTRIWTATMRSSGGAAGGPTAVLGTNGAHQLSVENAYNFGMQSYTAVNATIAPGDTLVTQCVYRTTPAYGAQVGNTIVAAGGGVVGGEATTDEMCMVRGRGQ